MGEGLAVKRRTSPVGMVEQLVDMRAARLDVYYSDKKISFFADYACICEERYFFVMFSLGTFWSVCRFAVE